MNEEFYVGQVFEGKYPPEAAIWCNKNNAYIEKIADNRYEIKEIPEPTGVEISAQRVAELKAKLADTDWMVTKIDEAKTFAPDTVEELIEKYRPAMEERMAWREEINSLENN